MTIKNRLREWITILNIIAVSAFFGYGIKTVYNGEVLGLGYWFLAVILQKYNIISFSKILLLLSIGFLSSFHHEMGRYVIFGREIYICLVIFFTFLVTVLFYSWQHNRVSKLALHE